jgi:hypothetical protein
LDFCRRNAEHAGATVTPRALRMRRHIEEEIFCPNNPEVVRPKPFSGDDPLDEVFATRWT